MLPVSTEHKKFNCPIMGAVSLTKNTPIKANAKFSSKIEGCSHSEECGVGLPFTQEKCDSIKNSIKD